MEGEAKGGGGQREGERDGFEISNQAPGCSSGKIKPTCIHPAPGSGGAQRETTHFLGRALVSRIPAQPPSPRKRCALPACANGSCSELPAGPSSPASWHGAIDSPGQVVKVPCIEGVLELSWEIRVVPAPLSGAKKA